MNPKGIIESESALAGDEMNNLIPKGIEIHRNRGYK